MSEMRVGAKRSGPAGTAPVLAQPAPTAPMPEGVRLGTDRATGALKSGRTPAAEAARTLNQLAVALQGGPTERAFATAGILADPEGFEALATAVEKLKGTPAHQRAKAQLAEIEALATPEFLAEQLAAQPDMEAYPAGMAERVAALGAQALPTGGPDERGGKWREKLKRLLEHPAFKQMMATVAAKSAEAPPSLIKSPYPGGTGMRIDQMDEASRNNNLMLRLFDKLPGRLGAAVTSGYDKFSRFAGPIGAFANLGLNVFNTAKVWSDPNAPTYMKVGMPVATAGAAVSAAGAGLVLANNMGWSNLATKFSLGPLQGLEGISRGVGVAGFGAGAVLSAMDTIKTFSDPNSTAAEKGFSALGTGSAIGLTALTLLGISGPIGIALGVGAMAFPLLKGFLAKNPVANAVFEKVGEVAKPVVDAVKDVGGKVVDGVKNFFGF